MQPFYKIAGSHPTALRAGQAQSANLGLFFNRFFNWTAFDTAAESYKTDKSAFLKQFSLLSYQNSSQMERAVARQMSLNQQQISRYTVMKSDWHWVTGLGNNHPLENGFTWHHSLGMPFLPGSSVKGLVRSYCELMGMDSKQLKQWFGSESKDPEVHQGDTQAGEVIFFDAIPCDKVDILPDIMTPHSGDWLQEGNKGKTAPADWHDPVPVPFLVARNLTLLFSISKANHSMMPDEELDEVLQRLEEALGFLGAGAKTATGYGSMSPSIKGKQNAENLRDDRLQSLYDERIKRQKEEANANRTENQRLIAQLNEDLENVSKKESAMAELKKLMDKALQEWSLEDRQALVSMLHQSSYMKITNKDKLKERKALLAKLLG